MSEDADGIDRKMEPTPRQAQPGLQASLPTVCTNGLRVPGKTFQGTRERV